MATFALNLGSSKTGLTTLKADFLNASGSTLSSTTSGFSELTGGQYLFTSSLPVGCVAVKFYLSATPSQPFFTIAVGDSPTIPAAGGVGSVNAYLYTRNSAGVITGNLPFSYQIVGVDSSYSDSWNSDINIVTSDVTGLVNVTMYVGTYVRYWVGNGRYRTVHITGSTANPLALVDVVGG